MPGATAQRTNNGWLATWERQTLSTLAAAMPSWVTPDLLTAVGVAGGVIIFAAYAMSAFNPAWLWVASLGLVINWFGDSLDGSLARFRKIERPRYGYFLDNAIDLVMQFLLTAGLALSGYVRADLCFVALSIFLMMSVLTLLRENVSGVFTLDYVGIGPTEMRLMIIGLNAVMYFIPPWPIRLLGMEVTYANGLVLIWCTGALLSFLWSMLEDIRRLAAEDPPRTR
jgi:phosphatidylglycerophosphate synthase